MTRWDNSSSAGDPERDPELGRALRELEESELAQVDWHSMARRVREAAREEFEARLPSWYHVTARWSRVAVPLAIAASALIVTLLRGAESPDQPAPDVRTTVEQRRGIADAMMLNRGTEVRDALIGDMSPEWLITEVVRR